VEGVDSRWGGFPCCLLPSLLACGRLCVVGGNDNEDELVVVYVCLCLCMPEAGGQIAKECGMLHGHR